MDTIGKRIKTLSQLFNVSSDYLLGLSSEPKSENKNSNIVNKIVDTSKKLKIGRQEKVLDYAKSELDEQNKVMEIADYQIEKEYPYYDDAVSAGTGQYIGTSQRETITLPVDFDADYVVPVNGFAVTFSHRPLYYFYSTLLIPSSVQSK